RVHGAGGHEGSPVARLEVWRREVDALFAHARPSTREGLALEPHVSRYGMKRADFDRLLEVLAIDARGDAIETEEDLARYCAGVAAAPGYLSLSVFGCPEAPAHPHPRGAAAPIAPHL